MIQNLTVHANKLIAKRMRLNPNIQHVVSSDQINKPIQVYTGKKYVLEDHNARFIQLFASQLD